MDDFRPFDQDNSNCPVSYQFRNVRPYPVRNVLFRAMFGGKVRGDGSACG